ncbi:MAG: transcription antitermination factor NusB [Microthrixaceae bacterium]
MTTRKPAQRPGDGDEPGVRARRLAGQVLTRVAQDGAYSNLALRHALDSAAKEPSPLESADARLVTDLVYGTLRRQRSCDSLINRFTMSDPPPAARSFLRLGAYQIAFRADIPAYAAVSSTVSAAPKRFRGLCNAVLRKVVGSPIEFHDEGDRLSYPDWIIERLRDDLGDVRAVGALEAMNDPAAQVTRDDGYSQDPASQMVVDLVGARPGDLVADLCASPGGKATGLANSGALVIASDISESRVHLLAGNARRFGEGRVLVSRSDAGFPGLRAGSFDHAAIDAPCSGLGVLRRRPDARWTLDSASPQRLSELQVSLIKAGVELLKPGGQLTYSVCTLTARESLGVDQVIEAELPGLEPLEQPGDPWEPFGRGSILLPQALGTDGMCLFRYRYSR